jgi:para-aminobenzoate synthetase
MAETIGVVKKCALCSATPDRGRFSFMGGRGGSLWRRITYKLSPEERDGPHCTPAPGTVVSEDAEGRISTQQSHFWEFLEAGVSQYRMTRDSRVDLLPFDFWGGYVGYLGYELKAECGSPNRQRSTMPDAALFLCDRCDHCP